jgi:hypothetical protein
MDNVRSLPGLLRVAGKLKEYDHENVTLPRCDGEAPAGEHGIRGIVMSDIRCPKCGLFVCAHYEHIPDDGYRSVYEILGAKLDEKDAENAILISRALEAEAKVNILTNPYHADRLRRMYSTEEVREIVKRLEPNEPKMTHYAMCQLSGVFNRHAYQSTISRQDEEHINEWLKFQISKLAPLPTPKEGTDVD